MIKKILSSIVSKIKNEDFSFDQNLPASYIVRFLFKRLGMLLRGLIIFRKLGWVFIEKNSQIVCKSKMSFISPLSIAESCYLDALSKEGILFGKNVSIGYGTAIECSGTLTDIGKGLKVGSNVGLGRNCFYGCAGGIEIGDDTIIGNFVSMHSENHNFQNPDIPIRLQGVTRKGIIIGKNCWIGAKVTILDGAIVEDGCVFAAGSVVRAGEYKKDSVFAGVPAKYVGSRIK